MPDLNRQGPGRQVGGFFQPAANAGGAEEILGEASEISNEAVESVVFGIDGPNDFVHRASQFARSGIDLIDITGCLGFSFEFATDSLAEHGDTGEAGAQVIVNIAGDAGALAFNRALAFKPL